MKLKLKLTLLFSVIVMLLVLIISLYIKIDVINHVMFRVGEVRNDYSIHDRQFARHINQLYPEISNVKKYMKTIALKENMIVTLYDKNLNKIYTYSGHSQGPAPAEEWYPVKNQNGHTVFFLKVQRALNIQNITMNVILTRTLLFLLALHAVIFIALMFYLNHLITKPIQQLNEYIRRMNSVGPPIQLSLKRKDEIGELYMHAHDLQQRLHQSSREQVDMIGAITHDLKTPLTSINGFIELLQTRKDLTEQSKVEYLKLIEKKSQDITHLMEIFSTYTKNEMMLPSMTFQVIHAASFFESIAAEYEAELAGLDISFYGQNSFNWEDVFYGDPTMLRRVFANIISNAVRYGNSQELKIFMKGYGDKKENIFVIEDNGVGVPEKDLQYLFQKFFTVDQSRQSEVGGTGLGLATVQSIIEKHSGVIHAFSSQHGGLGLSFSIPRALRN